MSGTARVLRPAFQFLFLLQVPGAAATVSVAVDPGIRYQTILGWGCASSTPPWATAELREEVASVAAGELGLTRLRLEPPGGNRSEEIRWERHNDNGDPEVLNWSAIFTDTLDRKVTGFVLPFKAAVEARGDPFDLYISPSFFNGGSTGEVPAWLLHSPGEYAEYALSLISYLEERYGIEATYYCILNEAGNNNPFSASVVARMIKALGPRLAQQSFATKIQFPECVNARKSWDYVQAVRDDEAVWRYVGLVSYHLYGTNDPYREYLRDFARTRNLPTGQTEYMGLTIDHLWDDLTKGGVSYWEIYGTGSQFEWGYNAFRRKSWYWRFRQVLNYVRPGAARIEASSSDAALRPLAFLRNGQTTVILINGSQSRSVRLRGLTSGRYGVCESAGSAPYRELGIHEAQAGVLSVTVSANAVMTIYPCAGENLPPVPTEWKADREYLIAPRSSVTLSAGAVDPELDVLSYAWEVTQKPQNASVVLQEPRNRQTQATALTEPGTYHFTVAVSDNAHTVTRTVRVSVFAENQPPLPLDVHNRMPVEVTLPESETNLRGAAWDLQGDPLTYRWRVISQPPGARVVLSDPTSTKCRSTAMTVPGDYVFAFEVSDGTHRVTEELTVTVRPQNQPPVISSLFASPSTVTLPQASTSLQAITSDPDGDTLTHWWSVKECPAGATAVFSHPGHASTDVHGLTAPGTYTFTLAAVDRTRVTRRDITVQVQPGPVESAFQRGDANADGKLDLADAVFVLGYLFAAGQNPQCRDAADANDDGKCDISDPIALLAYLFGAATSLPDPFPDCGTDPTADNQPCRAFDPCSGQ